jgi:glutamate synthase (NADPH/NADH) small chain
MSSNRLSVRERMKIPRQHMPEQNPAKRGHNFLEVNLGLGEQLAQVEANRCISCAKPTCVSKCPVGVQVKDFLKLVLAGDYLGAAAKIRESNALPAVTGRVCPQEDQCEGGCLLGNKGGCEPLAIGYLERFVADYEQSTGQFGMPPIAALTGKKIAIIGSGPAGLSCAGDLIQKGHKVRVFEALHEIGGVLIYGIPEFRLPKTIVKQEVDNLRRMGVEFETNVVVGKTVGVDELMNEEGYDAVFIATGAGLPQFLNVGGEHLNGVYSANEFLTRVNLMRAYDSSEFDSPVYDCRNKNVVVFGGGNTALDSVRTSLRLGARSASIVYRRSEAEMPARKEEVEHAKAEGINFHYLVNPIEFIGDDKGWLTAMRCTRMQLGEPDASGRRRPIPVPDSEFTTPVDMAIVAVGTTANPLIQSTTPDLETNKWNYIVSDPETQRTSKRGVFAGGDIVTGGATVILAMGAGRKAAKSIHDYLNTNEWETSTEIEGEETYHSQAADQQAAEVAGA